MAKTVGYLITWTTYGTWLQGDERGFVKDGDIRKVNPVLNDNNIKKLKQKAVLLNAEQRVIVREAIIEASRKLKQKIHAVAVCSNHVHIAAEYMDVEIGRIVNIYKNAGRAALKKGGFEGKLWTSGYDKRYCFDEESMQRRIGYVKKHRE